jgi:hypothetical protein
MPDSTSGSGETHTTSWTDAVATGGRSVVQSAEEGIGAVGRCTWEFFHDFPYLGGLIGGGLGLGAAMLIGVAELAAAVVTAYIGYRVFAYGESFTEAFAKSIELREGKLLEEEQRRQSTLE